MIQKWRDEFLSWNPREYGMINSTIIPFKYLWIPDTYLYNRYSFQLSIPFRSIIIFSFTRMAFFCSFFLHSLESNNMFH
uniref:Neur_chan_LBD domain-containing protein n=1 Tax=Angiostrongylus cantonensis TaxID=6313 RepID=A0A0K0CWT6_ANGCA